MDYIIGIVVVVSVVVLIGIVIYILYSISKSLKPLDNYIDLPCKDGIARYVVMDDKTKCKKCKP